jgi:hypothetical protein
MHAPTTALRATCLNLIEGQYNLSETSFQSVQKVVLIVTSTEGKWDQCPGTILSILSRDPRVSKSSQLHVDTYQIFLIDLRYTLEIS